MHSSVASTLGLMALSTSSCFFSSSFSSWEPKLLGSVLLRCRVLGVRPSSEIFSFDSRQLDLETEIHEAEVCGTQIALTAMPITA